MRPSTMLWLTVFAWICAIVLIVFFGIVVFGEKSVSVGFFIPAGIFHSG